MSHRAYPPDGLIVAAAAFSAGSLPAHAALVPDRGSKHELDGWRARLGRPGVRRRPFVAILATVGMRPAGRGCTLSGTNYEPLGDESRTLEQFSGMRKERE